ncbi:MAG: FecR domain-containing protein [Candidatus Thermoplasmatota archaeon]|nr:FecR domain-containing protein [Candidatus Thermoplasmatota archaeon]
MSKRVVLLLAALVVVVLCISGIWWFTQSSAVAKAQLVIDKGSVQVRHGTGAWGPADTGMSLYQDDTVQTGENTSASIILFESCILRLDSNTQVTVQEIIQEAEANKATIQQGAGRTWSTISKISGIESYEVQTPVAVASVRGTSFYVEVQTNGRTTVGVGSGTVNVSRFINNQKYNSTPLKSNESVTIGPDEPLGPLVITPFEKDTWIEQNQQKDDEQLALDKVSLYDKLAPYIDDLKSQYGVTDQELEVLIDGYLRGDFTLPPDTPEWIRDLFES